MTLEKLLGKEEVKKFTGKAFGIDSNLRYDDKDFVKKAGELFELNNYYHALTKNTGDMSALKGIIDMAVPYMPGNPEENAQLLRDPFVASEQAEVLLQAGNKKMAKFIEYNLRSILRSLPNEKMIRVATGIINRDKDYRFYSAALESQDVEAIRNDYLQRYGTTKDGKPDEFYLRIGMESSAEHLLQYAQVQMQRMQKRFQQKNLYSESMVRDESGRERKVMKYDSKQAQNYFINSMEGLKDGEKENMLLQVAQVYAQERASKSSEKKKAA